MFSRFNSNKCKTQAKMCISRTKLMRNKRLIGLRQLRREVAELLKQGKQGNARIRVEAVIRENFTLQAYDIVELFLELISVRVPLLEKAKEMPPDMMEAICSIIYAGDRMSTDLPEMAVIRHILVGKYSPVYGKEFAMEASSELTCRKWHVNENLVSCLVIEAPSPQEKIRVLADIAAEHGVEFDEDAAAADMLTGAPRPQPAAVPFPGMADGPPAPFPAAYGAPPPWATLQPAAPTAAPPASAPAAMAPGYMPVGGAPALPPQPAVDVASTLTPGVGLTLAPGWAPPQAPAAQPGDGYQGHMSSVSNWVKAKRSGSPPVKDHPDPAGYQDASAAAQAAREFSTMAQHAADAAEQYARSQAGGPPPAGGDGASGSTGRAGGGSGGQVLPGGFVKRSDTDIQRAYDAAPGPPSKADVLSQGPPSAPPAPSAPAAPQGGVAGAQPTDAGSSAAEDLDLPSAPAGVSKPAAGGSQQNEVDRELEELTRRFEALKRR